MEVGSKRKFYELWHAGVLGNRPATWRSVEEAVRSGHTRFGIREVGKTGGGKFQIVYGTDALIEEMRRWRLENRAFSIDGGVLNETVLLQGEMCRTTRGLEGMFAVRSGTDIREAFRRGLFKPKRGLEVYALLQHFMDPSSRDDIDAIWDLFPESVIEFACFPENVGVLPHRNTIIWEVRNY